MSLSMRLKLIESLDACQRLQIEVLDLVVRLKPITRLTELCKVEAKRQVQALTKGLEEKTAMEVNLSGLFSLHDQLRREFSPSYSRDLYEFVESWRKNNRKNDKLLSVSQQEHKSEKKKLVKALTALDKGVRSLRSDLVKAQQESDALCEEFTVLGGILDKNPFTVEGFGGETSTSNHPTLGIPPEKEEDMKLMLIELLNECFLLQEQVPELDRRLQEIMKQIEQCKEEKLRKEMNALDEDVKSLSNDLRKARQQKALMCEECTILRKILDKHPVTIEGFGGENSTSTRPTKKPRFEKDAGRSIEKAIDVRRF